MKLADLYENPDNPSKCTEEQLERLAGKLKRVPQGLTAMRVAYVLDDDGRKMVISGNKRLRVLKKMYGEDGDVPDEWFQDVTSMSEAERHEFIVTANVSDGDWDIDKLLDQYDVTEFKDLGIEQLLGAIPSTNFDDLTNVFGTAENTLQEKKKKTITCPHCGKEIEL